VIVASILQPLEDLMSWALVHLHEITGSWSWSIVALTIIVRMLLVPLTVGRSTRCRTCRRTHRR
jgi:membrane protein insertase Oxa1/YidC/SpoIIIJ